MKVWVLQAAASGVAFGDGELPPLTLDTVGEHVGDEPYPHDGNPWVPKGRRNPKIVLQDGSVVWGCECWWGPADEGQEVAGPGPPKLSEPSATLDSNN